MMKQPETAPGKGFRRMITIERTFRANAKELWDLWTTREGLESWWGPEGFTMKVTRLEVRPGGRFEYEMTATAPEQMEALKRENLPLVSRARSTYTEIKPPRRLAMKTLADFIPGVTPYEVVAVTEFHPVEGGTRVVIIEDAMHSEEWTNMSIMGMNSSLDKLERVLERRKKGI